MSKRIFPFLIFLLTPLLSLHPQKLLSQDSNNPYLSFFSQDRPVSGLVEFSSVQDPKIGLSSYNISGQAKLEIYQASVDDVLQYLIHDDKYQQLFPKVDSSKFTHISDLDINLSPTTQEVSLPLAQTGIFFIRLKMGNLENQTYIIRSPFGTIAREAKDTLVLWSQDYATKRSLGSGKATLYSLQKQKNSLGIANLDADAVASLPLSQDADVAVVENNGAVSIVPLNARYLNGQYTWLTFRPNLLQKRYFIFTDRPIYKPGDTVRFKAIVRDDDDARYSLPSGSVSVEVSQGWDRKIYLLKDNLNVDSNGFVSTSFTIPKTAKTGDYQIKLNPGSVSNYYWDDSGNGDSIFFKVENYRKPEYFINAQSPQIDVVRGDAVNVKISGEYYSGQPLAGVKVNYTVKATDYGGYESEYYYPDNGNHYYRSWYGADVDSGTLTLDSKGQAQVTLPTDKNDSKGKHQIYYFEFTYQDDSGNPSLTGVNVSVRSGEYSLYKDGYDGYGGKPNDPINMPFILKANRQGLSLSQKVDVRIVRHWWEEFKDPNSKYPTYNQKQEDVGNYSFSTDNSGKAIFNFTPITSGSYYVNTVITDSRGNKISKTFYLWVNDQYTYYNNNYGRPSTIRIITDKKTYRPGDNALISLTSDIPDRDVFLAFERGYQDRYQVVHLSGKQTNISAPVYDHDVPNMYFTAKTFDSDGLAGDVQNITIDPTGKHAYFTLSTDKQNYAPGDDVTVNVAAKDSSGNPLATNFALWSVDKSIFALADKNYGDVFSSFWDSRYDNTTEANSLEGIMVISAAEKGGCFVSGTKIKMGDGSEKSIEDVKVGDEILTRLSDISSKLVKTKVTAIHSTLAPDYYIINQTLRVTGNHLLFVNQHWRQAGLTQIGDELTDSQGNQVKVTSLERLRGKTAVYNLTTDRYHTYFANNLYVHNQKGNAPRDSFADTAYWNVSVNTNSQGMAQVKFKLPDNLTTWVITALGATVDTRVGEAFTEIKVNKDLVIRPALPNVLGDADLVTLTAMVNNFTDIPSHATVSLKTDAGQLITPISQTIDVAPNDFSQVSWQIKVGKPGSAKFEFSIKDDKNRSDTIVQKLDIRSSGYWQQSSEFKIGANNFSLSQPDITFDSQKTDIKLSISSSILGSLPSAMTYLINYPYGCTEQTTSGLLPKIISKKYPTIFADALKQQSKSQTIDAGIDKLTTLQNSDGGWPWWWGNSNSLVTAYVYRLLTEARNVGVKVNDSLFVNAQTYFLSNFDGDTPENKVAKAYGLSFSTDPKIRKTIVQDLDKLDNDYLAMAVTANLAGGLSDPARNGLDLLLSRAQTNTNGIYWLAGKSDHFGSIESSTALAIQALIKSNTHLSESAKAINYLMRNRHFDYWASTYATAQTILAVTDFSQLQKEPETNLNYTVALNGKTISNGKLIGIQTTPVEFSINSGKVTKSGNLTVSVDGVGELYSTLTQKWWLKDPSGSQASRGVSITKKITNHKGEQYNLAPGDLVDVVLSINFDPNTPDTSSYALIEDHLPAGLIPVNTKLNNESGDGGYSYDYSREYLLDGIIIPIYYGGYTRTYTYQARVISAGTFNVPPAYFGLMYYPEIWARSGSSSVTVDTTTSINPLTRIRQSIPETVNQVGLTPKRLAFFTILLVTLGLIAFYVKKKKTS